MYTLRFPFQVPEGKEINIENEICTRKDGLNFILNKQDRFYVLTVDGFDAEETASNYINNVWSGFMWLLLHKGLPLDAVFSVRNAVYYEDPEDAAKNIGLKDPVDGAVDGNSPSVFITDKKICKITAGEVSVSISYPAEDVLGFFFKGLEFQCSDKVIQNSKLKVAFELYGAFYTEVSANARFLTLVMAMEVLATETLKTELVLDLISKWKSEAKDALIGLDESSDDHASLDSLMRELMFRRSDSIRRQVRSLVSTALHNNGDEDAEETARKFLKIYDNRSKLVHTGQIEQAILSQSIQDGKVIVERVLKSFFIQEAYSNQI